MWRHTDRRITEYRAMPLFAQCTRGELRAVSHAAARLTVEPGTVLAREGQPRRDFVIVLEGTAKVWRHGRPVDEIGAGGYFGEIALVRRVPQPASVVAKTRMTIDVIAPREFAVLYEDLGAVRQTIDHEIDRRVAHWIAQSVDVRARGEFAAAS